MHNVFSIECHKINGEPYGSILEKVYGIQTQNTIMLNIKIWCSSKIQQTYNKQEYFQGPA